VNGRSSDGPRRLLADASAALDEFRRASGAADAGPAVSEAWRSSAEAASLAALGSAHDRIRALEGELATARADAAREAAENGRLGEQLERAARAAGEIEGLRVRLAETEARANAMRERAALLEAEGVRLDSLRRGAERAVTDAAATERAVEESLRRDLRAAHAALDRAAAQAGQTESQLKGENDSLRARLEAAATRLQSFEREKRLELARGTGDLNALQTEVQRALATAAALRRELTEQHQQAERRELELRRELAAARARPAPPPAAETAFASLPPAPSPAPAPQLPSAPVPPVPAAEDEWPALETAPEIAALPDFVSPSVEPLLDPGWARLLRLVRPPVEAAYGHLRRLSATALTVGQKAVLRMAASSIAQASDALGSVELSLADGPATAGPATVLPALEAALAAWEPAFRRRGVTLTREWGPSLPPVVHDPRELRVLVFHVLRNVLEAVPRGGRLSVRAARDADGGVRVEFVDDGPGYPAAWLERRFEPFAAPRHGRAGLGLSLVRRTLRRWGGDAEAANGAGRGARLTWSFPPPAPEGAPAA
jgi:hypothetical protein